ncbi:MAG TPA: bile acid:sodium symporter [Jatrophihabitantaceae bacterium]
MEALLGRVADGLYNVALVVALWATGLALGLSLKPADLLAPFRNVSLLARVFALDALVIPVLVWALTELFAVPTESATGLLLVGVASAGPLGITTCRIAGGDTSTAVSLVVVFEAANVVVIPVWAAILLPSGTHVSLAAVVATLLLLVVAPLAVGVAVRARWGPWVQRWAPPLATLSSALVVVVVVAVLVHYGSNVIDATEHGAAAVAAITVLAALGLGWAAGGPATGTRIAAAMVTGVRANGLALAIARASYPSHRAVEAAVVTFGVLSIVLPCVAAYSWAAYRAGRTHRPRRAHRP